MNEKLVLENIKLIYLAIEQLNLCWQTEDDWQYYYDDGLEGLLLGVKTYDSTKNIKISTYLMVCIKNQIKRGLYAKTRKKRKNEAGKDFSLDYPLVGKNNEKFFLADIIPDENVNIEEKVEEIIMYEEVLEAIQKIKKEKNRMIMWLYFGIVDGKCYTINEISKIFGTSQKNISSIIHRTKKEVKNILEQRK